MLVLRELAALDLLFPAVLVPLRPLPAAKLRGERGIVPGLAVRLALVALLGLRFHHLLALAAGGKAEGCDEKEGRSHERPGVCCCGCGGVAPGLPGP
ncbi:hypothetical protein D3C83_63900 [compost metagenome]